MKKAIMLFAMVIFFASVSAQEKETPISETERIVDKYIDKTGDIINGLAEKLAVPAEHVYGVLVRQQIVQGVVWSVYLGFFILLFLFGLFGGLKYDMEFADWDEFSRWKLIIVISVLFSVIGFIGFFTDGLPSLINPEYGAIKEIMEAL
jgi:hypothetical protein